MAPERGFLAQERAVMAPERVSMAPERESQRLYCDPSCFFVLHRFRLFTFYFSGSYFHFDADPDQASQNYEDTGGPHTADNENNFLSNKSTV
jgi:hypothetical protein